VNPVEPSTTTCPKNVKSVGTKSLRKFQLRKRRMKDKPNILIRDLVIEDFDNEEFIQPICEMESTKDSITVAELREIFLKRQSTTDTFIAIVDEKIVGVVSLAIWYSFSGRNLGLPMDMYVLEEYRRLGVGHELLNFMGKLFQTRPHGVWRIVGPVGKDLIPFYEKHAFQKMDVVYMERKLDMF